MPLIHPRTREFFLYFARAYPRRTIAMVLLLVASGVLEGISVITLVPVLDAATASEGGASTAAGQAVENVLRSIGLQPSLWTLVGLVVVAISSKAVVLWLAMRQVGFTVAKVMLDLRLELVRAILNARWSYFGSQQVGGFANAISREAVRSANGYREACVVIGSIVQILIYIVVSALISWEVTLVAIVTGVALLRSLRFLIAMGRSAGEQEMTLTRSLAARLVDALQGIKPMKAMARENLFWPLLASEAEGLDRAHRKSVIASESLRLFQEPVVSLVLGIGLVVLLTIADRSFSAVLVLAFVFYRLMGQINGLQTRYQYMVNGEAMFWSLRHQIDEAKAAAERHEGSVHPAGLADAIELRNVGFSYGELTVLRDLSIRIPAGQMTAIVGESGSGKTTILDLITGLRRPDEGEVYVDGVPMSEIDLKSWRELIGYVPQDVFLFHDTVRRNVTLGDDTISDERVEQALRDAGAWDFIARDTQGIGAFISPQGSNLSGGQRQRLAIARAIVRRPALMVLDEATSGLDTRTEAAIIETLRALRGDVTILAISHQPALRDAADLTLLIEDGQVRDPRQPATSGRS